MTSTIALIEAKAEELCLEKGHNRRIAYTFREDAAIAIITDLLQRNKELDEANFALSAGACIVKNGLLSGEGGSPYCTLLQRCEKAEAESAASCSMVVAGIKAREAAERQRDEARKALEPFARIEPVSISLLGGEHISSDAFRAARNAMGEPTK
ncbi:hypothetical protein [Candidatus Phyllobacterium onerii]|uniref:hypothetical protein n=1 Tax=Candidatus Phyllobacterium onerii TaxID=3020828 RepID=UPI0023301142|nr:hypothetical protein [Phyllobacterium sp. IY22]